MSAQHTAEDERIQPTREPTGMEPVVLADLVCQMMRECRARLAAEDAARGLAHARQAARALPIEPAATD